MKEVIMYQIFFSIDERRRKWFDEVEEVLAIRLRRHNALMATQTHGGRLGISVACENASKSAVTGELRSVLTDMYATVVKTEFLSERLNLPLDRHSFKILLHTLVAFDRQSERDLIEEKLTVCDRMALDGIFDFLLGELRERWKEIASLACDNAAFLVSEDTLIELIRFLIGAVDPKVLKLELWQSDGKYSLKGSVSGGEFVYRVGGEQLLAYLIDLAPVELSMRGKFDDKKLYKRVTSIFDVKTVDNSGMGIQR